MPTNATHQKKGFFSDTKYNHIGASLPTFKKALHLERKQRKISEVDQARLKFKLEQARQWQEKQAKTPTQAALQNQETHYNPFSFDRLPSEVRSLIMSQLEDHEDITNLASAIPSFTGAFLDRYPEVRTLLTKKRYKLTEPITPEMRSPAELYISLYDAIVLDKVKDDFVFSIEEIPSFVYTHRKLPKGRVADKNLLYMAAQIGNVDLCIELLDKEGLCRHWHTILGDIIHFGKPTGALKLLQWYERNQEWLQIVDQPIKRNEAVKRHLIQIVLPIAISEGYAMIVKKLVDQWKIYPSDARWIEDIFLYTAKSTNNTPIWQALLSQYYVSLPAEERQKLIKQYKEFERCIAFNVSADIMFAPGFLLIDVINNGDLKQAIFYTEHKKIKITQLVLREITLSQKQSVSLAGDLHQARQRSKKARVVRYLLESNLALVEKMNLTAQQELVQSMLEIGYVEVLDYLISSLGWDIVDYNQAIDCAAQNGYLDVIKYLIGSVEAHVDVVILNRVLNIAIEQGYAHIVCFLSHNTALQKIYSIEAMLEKSIRYGQYTMVHSLICAHKNSLSLDGEAIFTSALKEINQYSLRFNASKGEQFLKPFSLKKVALRFVSIC